MYGYFSTCLFEAFLYKGLKQRFSSVCKIGPSFVTMVCPLKSISEALTSSSVLTHVTYFFHPDKPSQTWASNPG